MASYAPPTFIGVTNGCAVTNGMYRGWCVQYSVLIEKGPVYQGELFDSLAAALPPALQGVAWNKINYILNHKLGNVADIQNAIWVALGQAFDPPFTTNAQAMVDAAAQFGPGFVPGPGQMKAIIVEPTTAVQRLVFEIPAEGTNSPALFLSQPQRRENGEFEFTLHGPDAAYVVEGSTNLNDWLVLGVVPLTNGAAVFRDTNAPLFNLRFYRAQRQ